MSRKPCVEIDVGQQTRQDGDIFGVDDGADGLEFYRRSFVSRMSPTDFVAEFMTHPSTPFSFRTVSSEKPCRPSSQTIA